ncbi:MAG: sigma-70 family RNA polymerase sigma factor [Eubacteriales bacterium]|nr:sigma-70 family RNA polymerase sigma factor [Eubacteriales bacterium]
MTYHIQTNDRLRAEFTQFLKIMVTRAKLNYIKKYRTSEETVSLEELSDWGIPSTSMKLPQSNTTFDYEVESLAEAFEKLTPRRQQILQLIFVEGLSSQEVAERIRCSVGHVYNEQSLAIKKLRELMEGEKQ